MLRVRTSNSTLVISYVTLQAVDSISFHFDTSGKTSGIQSLG